MSSTNKLLKRLGLFIQYPCLDGATCADLARQMTNAPGQAAEIYTSAQTTGVDSRARRALSVVLPEAATVVVENALTSLRADLERHFAVTLAGHESPHYLVYGTDAFFVAHRDRPLASNLETSTRKISVVLFLNADFTGGTLNMYGLIDGPEWERAGFACEAAAGLLVAFPSSTLHEVTRVTSGQRCTIVTWFS